MSGAIDTRTRHGFRIELHPDEDCSSPRENDNLGTILCWHRRYYLSDRKGEHVREFKGGQYAEPTIEPADFDPSAYPVCLPVYLLDHSGLSLSTRDYGDKWDSGQVGWIYVTRAQLQHEYSVKRITRRTLEQATAVLQAEIAEYHRYLSGECYGYVIRDPAGDEAEDGSCWGFIGAEYCWESAEAEADRLYAEQLLRADALVDEQRSEN